ncbi:MAG: hypothetical protein NC319_05935 [Butyricicoccus sp.]|nr:hypothetical protein [Butyricicoccus sp.]
MRSRTSYFNRTLFLKTVTRFWPLWLIYFAAWFVAMPLALSSNLRWGGTALTMQADICAGASTVGIVAALIAGCVAAMAAWSFMYSARSTSGMASLPLRRECVFFSVSLGGIAPLLAVNVLIFLLCLAIQGFYGMADAALLGQWLGAVTLELIFFYGFALLCAQLTGSLAVLPLVYLVLNFTAYVVMQLLSSLMEVFVYGAADGIWSDAFLLLTPVLGMMTRFTTDAGRVYVPEDDYYRVERYYLSGWGALFAYAAVGLALAALALWLYRRRRMESAGDVVAVNILKPVFKYCMTFGCALCLGSLLFEMSRGYGFGYAVSAVLVGVSNSAGYGRWESVALMTAYMLIGAFIGYFASEMLIHKSFRVWRGRWAGVGVSAVLIAALMLGMELDLFGYERRVPDPDSVASVYISTTQFYRDGASYRSDGGVTLSEPENIAAAARLHRSVVERKAWYEGFDQWGGRAVNSGEDYIYRSMMLSIDYELKNGRHVTRSYDALGFYLDDASTQTDARAAQELLNTPEAILARKHTAFDYTAETIRTADAECTILPGDARDAIEGGGEVYDYKGYSIGHAADPSLIEAETEEGLLWSAVWSFTPEEAEELYNDCILPDMADGTIGTVWLITDEEYESTVYDMRISIDARMLEKDGPVLFGGPQQYRYDNFYTVPTVNSARTNRWLAEHGVIMRTVAETGYADELYD